MCGMCVQIKGPVKGLSEIVPTFETVFVLACHYAVCKGMRAIQGSLRGLEGTAATR